MPKICYSLFSGCGGSDSGMVAAGYESFGGVEYHQPAADIYNLNHANPVTVANILDIDSIPTVDLLWCSPPCPAFSIANPNRGETDNDLALAHHLAKLIKNSHPGSIAIENVRGYTNSQSLAIIVATLLKMGYEVRQLIECAANYGVPTTRERLIVRASLSSMTDLVHTHQKPSDQVSLFQLPNWVGWWEVIKDRVDELPRSQLTENQTRILNQQGLPVPLLVNGDGNRYNSSYTTLPAPTITASQSKHPMRVLIERVGYYNGKPHAYKESTPSPTIRAHQHIDGFRGSYRVAYNIVDNYDCYAADIKCLAAWQGFPPTYHWGTNRGEAGRSIGNAVCPPLAKAIAESFG